MWVDFSGVSADLISVLEHGEGKGTYGSQTLIVLSHDPVIKTSIISYCLYWTAGTRDSLKSGHQTIADTESSCLPNTRHCPVSKFHLNISLHSYLYQIAWFEHTAWRVYQDHRRKLWCCLMRKQYRGLVRRVGNWISACSSIQGRSWKAYMEGAAVDWLRSCNWIDYTISMINMRNEETYSVPGRYQ